MGTLVSGGHNCIHNQYRHHSSPRTDRHTRRNDNDNEQDNNAQNQTHSHLHILPPELFPHAVRPLPEALCRHGEIVRLVLQRVEVLAALGHFVDVLAHHVDCAVDFLQAHTLAILYLT